MAHWESFVRLLPQAHFTRNWANRKRVWRLLHSVKKKAVDSSPDIWAAVISSDNYRMIFCRSGMRMESRWPRRSGTLDFPEKGRKNHRKCRRLNALLNCILNRAVYWSRAESKSVWSPRLWVFWLVKSRLKDIKIMQVRHRCICAKTRWREPRSSSQKWINGPWPTAKRSLVRLEKSKCFRIRAMSLPVPSACLLIFVRHLLPYCRKHRRESKICSSRRMGSVTHWNLRHRTLRHKWTRLGWSCWKKPQESCICPIGKCTAAPVMTPRCWHKK